MRRSPRSEGWTIPGCRAGAPRAFFINDNLAWTVGSHELRFGTNSRIFRLNDYDFGEGAVPLVTYTTLPQFIYGVASTASRNFPAGQFAAIQLPESGLLCAGHLEGDADPDLDLRHPRYLQLKPVNPHDAVARLAGSFDSISHDVNQPLSQVIRTQAGNIFAATPAAILQPRTAIAWQIAPHTVLRSGFGLFSDILPGSVVDLVGTNPPYSKTFQGGLLGTVGGVAIAPGVPNSAIDATAAANQLFNSGFAQGQLSCASPLANPNYLPSADFDHRRSGWQAPCALLHAVELRGGAPDRATHSICELSMSARARSTSPTRRK